jgi:hypothetical protein
MVIHFILWSKHGKMEQLGKFCPKLSGPLLEIFLKLYDVLLKDEEAPINNIAAKVHQILYKTYTWGSSVKSQVSTAMEQSIVLSMAMPHIGVWLFPMSLTIIFAQVQQMGFSVFLHTAWIGGTEAEFVLEKRESVEEPNEEEHDEFASVSKGSNVFLGL